MKKTLLRLFTAGLICGTTYSGALAQTVSTFENLTLAAGTYWNGQGAAAPAGFSSGNAFFPNYFDETNGYWAGGWAYSNVKDSVTSGAGNLYASRAGSGHNGSANYAVGQMQTVLRLEGPAAGKLVSGVYVTNTAYAFYSMQNGDQFAKKFGGDSGNDPDWFKLVIRKYEQGVQGEDSVEFFLADFRSENNTEDYIVKDWSWVDLTSLGNADSLEFTLSSSDVNEYGMNTPGFFCIDDFTTADYGLSVAKVSKVQMNIYPNPATEYVNIRLEQDIAAQVTLLDAAGKVCYSGFAGIEGLSVPVAHLPAGIYFVKVSGDGLYASKSFIKQ